MSLYDDLGVAPDATQADISSAFRRASKAMHPDAGGGTAEFARLSAAYDILKDPEKRARYDATGQSAAGHDPRADAKTHIATVFEQFVHEFPGDLTKIDMAAAIREALTMPLTEIVKKIAAGEAKATYIEGRIKELQGQRWRADPDARAMIDAILKAMMERSARGRQGLAQLRELKKSYELALDMWKSVAYRADEPPRMPQAFMSRDYDLSQVPSSSFFSFRQGNAT